MLGLIYYNLFLLPTYDRDYSQMENKQKQIKTRRTEGSWERKEFAFFVIVENCIQK